jgi:hypothetical protein
MLDPEFDGRDPIGGKEEQAKAKWGQDNPTKHHTLGGVNFWLMMKIQQLLD